MNINILTVPIGVWEQHSDRCKDLMVRGRAMPIYECRNWGKNPYYTFANKPQKQKIKSHMYESIEDKGFNWLGIDDQEARNYQCEFHEGNILSHYDGGNPQDRSNILEDEYSGNFMGVQGLDLSNNLDIHKEIAHHSEEIIAINDTENEILVPEEMQVQGIGEGEECDEIY